jgi:CheY-like chemotaxis protein
MNKKRKPKILLVDDDKDMCESLADVLTIDSNYTTRYCTKPQEAVKLIKEESFDLIILDYKMPEMNGLELMKSIREVKPKPIIFMLTAFISNDLIEEAKKEGAQKVLSKFIWPDEILKHIKEVLG